MNEKLEVCKYLRNFNKASKAYLQTVKFYFKVKHLRFLLQLQRSLIDEDIES